jgi:hypothetical protein
MSSRKCPASLVKNPASKFLLSLPFAPKPAPVRLAEPTNACLPSMTMALVWNGFEGRQVAVDVGEDRDFGHCGG